MMAEPRGAVRMPAVSGWFAFLLATLLFACQAPPPLVDAGGPPEPPDPVITPGSISSERESLAVELFFDARDAQGDDRPEEAAELAAQVVDEFPSASVSGRALHLLAEAALAAGQWERADEAGERYVRLLPPDDVRRAETRVLQARAMAGAGDQEARLDRLLRIGPEAPTELMRDVTPGAREAATILTRSQIEGILQGAPPGQALSSVVLARYAVLLQADGATESARGYARAALEADAGGPDSLAAASVLNPEVASPAPPEERADRPVRIGSILPLSGSPAEREMASFIAEGIQVAVAVSREEGSPVELAERDDAGDPADAAQLLEELESDGILGAIGFLQSEALEAAARTRQGELSLISPSASTPGARHPGVLTLAGADPGAATAVADYAADKGYVRVAIIHSRVPASVEEADAFERRARAQGVPVVGRFAYDAGATFFEDPIRAAREVLRMAEIRSLALGEGDTLQVEELDPVALFVPIPAEDVEFVAPQLTFFGLDTLGVDVMGTSGWTDPEVLETVSPRYTTGIVATTASGSESAGYTRFREAYEEYFQRSLVSPLPAMGYDAALLMLDAIRRGARTPAQVRDNLDRVRELEGATGVFSVVDGRVIRRQEVVRIEDGATVPAR